MSEGGTEASVTIDEQSSAPVVQVGAQRPGKQRHGRGGDGGEKVKNILDTAEDSLPHAHRSSALARRSMPPFSRIPSKCHTGHLPHLALPHPLQPRIPARGPQAGRISPATWGLRDAAAYCELRLAYVDGVHGWGGRPAVR